MLAVECFAALLPRRPDPLPPAADRPRLAVLIPAHDEGANLLPTLRSAAAQLAPGDRLLVVADNCTDDTAAVARANGAEVVERADPDRRGKGYALAFGRDALRADPPAVVVVLDADCTLGPDALLRLAARAATGRPAQAAYRMVAPAGAGPGRQVAAFAFLVKNVVRPLGLKRLGQPCLLTGTGMAFPWAVFAVAPLATGHIVEDMGLAIDLAVAGRPPVFVPEAAVWGEFPADDAAAATQRRRWEHGHLGIIRAGVPRLLAAAVRRRRVGLLALALEVGVPPLSALALASILAPLALLGWVAVGGGTGPATWLAASGGAAALALGASWWQFGRTVLPARTLAHIPAQVFGKIPLYSSFVTRPERKWVRTSRDHDPTESTVSNHNPTT